MKKLLPIFLALLLVGCAAAPEVQPAQPPAEPSAPETTVPQTTAPPILSPEQVILSRMSLRQKVGQLFMVRPDALDLQKNFREIEDPGIPGVSAMSETLAQTLNAYPVGGFVLFSKNITDPDQLLALNTALSRSMEIPPFLSVDEEGGLVARLGNHPGFSLPRYPSAGSVGASGGPEAAGEMGTAIGSYLRQYGFNMDFAPVADVNTNPKNPVIGTRSFSPDPEQAAACARAMADGLKAQGILPVFKHFPGHGDTRTDSHTGAASSEKTMEQLQSCELLPFLQATEADCIMVGHIGMPEVTGEDTPATLSYAITTGILRRHMVFQGLIITDSLSMGAILQTVSPEEAALQALEAGADILLMPESLPQAFDAIVTAVETGQISQQRLDDSVLRILHFKIENGILLPS